MKKVILILFLVFTLQSYAQDYMCYHAQIDSSMVKYFDKPGSLKYEQLNLNKNNTYFYWDSKTIKTEQGSYTIVKDKITLTSNDGTTKIFTYKKLDRNIISLSTGTLTRYFIRYTL